MGPEKTRAPMRVSTAFAPPTTLVACGRSRSCVDSRRRRRGVVAVAQPASSRTAKKQSAAADSGAPGPGALERESAAERYVDLRSLKKVGWHDVRVAASPAPGCRFGPFDVPSAAAAIEDELLFGSDTVPLSPPQEAAVRALLSRRSVLLSATMPNREVLVIDLAARAKEWHQTIVYCAPTLRAAEAMYAVVCTHAAGEKSVCLDLGHESVDSKSTASLVITVPRVLRRAVVDEEECWWMSVSDLVILDDIFLPGIMEWEEIMLSMPSRVLLCIFASDLSAYEIDELPLWLGAIQNSVVPVAGEAPSRFINRIDRAVDAPPVRAFVYNAARHTQPVQMSLSLALEELRKDFAVSQSWSKGAVRSSRSSKSMRNLSDIESPGNGDFESALLHGVEVLCARNVNDLAFGDPSHSVYADVAALVVADARYSYDAASAKATRSRKKAAKTKRRSTVASQASALRRRRRQHGKLLPALVFAHGRQESELAAGAVIAAVADESIELVYDDETADILASIAEEFRETHKESLSAKDMQFISNLCSGVGVVHDGVLPCLRSLAEELFRDGIVPVLCVDSHVGTRELASMPRARSVLVQASAIAEQSNAMKGLIKGTVIGSLAGRPDLDDVGNVIAMWYDEGVTDAEASCELTSALFASDLAAQESSRIGDKVLRSRAASFEALGGAGYPSVVIELPGSRSSGRRRSGAFLTTYSGLLGVLRRHGNEGHLMVADYTLDSYRSWLVGAGVRATREKVEVEKRAVDEHLMNVDWNELAMHDRIEAKLNEQVRLYRAMAARKDGVLCERLFEALKASPGGTVIGLRPKTDALRAAESPELPAGEWMANGRQSVDSAHSRNETATVSIELAESDDDKEDIIPAVLVRVFESSEGQTLPCPVESAVLVVCILVDSMWTVVPIEDVLAVMSDKCIAPNIDHLPIPHLATFDRDPVTSWAKCKPLSEPEAARINGVAEMLMSDLTTSKSIPEGLKPMKLMEFENQLARVRSAKEAYESSAWRGREEEMAHLRRLRRRALELGDEAESLRNIERRLESAQRDVRTAFDARLHGMLAVLEDCNSISIPSGGSLEMTPIGVLASLMPGPYPVFAAACLVLTSGLGELAPSQLAAVVAMLVAGPDRSMSTVKPQSTSPGLRGVVPGDAEEQHLYGFGRKPGESWEVDDLLGVLPMLVLDEMERIRSALLVVQRRHVDANMPLKASSWIAPRRLSTSIARSVHHFVEKEWDWVQVVRERGMEAGEVVREFRQCVEALDVITRSDSSLGELVDLQESCTKALESLRTWPIVDSGDVVRLAKSGLSGSRVFGVSNRTASYKSWWERVAAEFEIAKQDSELAVQHAEVELVADGGCSDDESS